MVRRILAVTPVLAGAVVLLVLSAAPPAVIAQGTELDGRVLFDREKCGMCHGIAPLGVEATVKIESMRGPDLSEVEARDSELMVDYLRQKTEIDGVKHKKAFGGSDEELGALVSWLEEIASAEGDDG